MMWVAVGVVINKKIIISTIFKVTIFKPLYIQKDIKVRKAPKVSHFAEL
jgi:hypothetical protein